MRGVYYSMGIIYLLRDCANLAQSLAAEYGARPLAKHILTSSLGSNITLGSGLRILLDSFRSQPEVSQELLKLCEQFVTGGNELAAAVEERTLKPDSDGEIPSTQCPNSLLPNPFCFSSFLEVYEAPSHRP
jgi:hypothetical protein